MNKLIEDLHSKIYLKDLIDPTAFTRQMYFDTIHVKQLDLKFILDPDHYYLQQILNTMKNISQRIIDLYLNDTKSMITSCMMTMKDVVLTDKCLNTHTLHQFISD